MSEATKERTPAAERKQSRMGIVRRGDFVVLIDQHWFPCGNVNVELDDETSAIAVVLEDKKYDTTRGGLKTEEFKHFNVRQFWKDPSRPQKCYTHESIRKLIFDYNERMRPDPGMPRAQQEAIWQGAKAFEEQYTGEPEA